MCAYRVGVQSEPDCCSSFYIHTYRARAQQENRAFSGVVWCWVGLVGGWVVPREVGSSARRVRSRPPPLTPADGHHRCFWLRHRPRRAPCARRHRASNVIDRAACCVDAFLWLSSRAFCGPAGVRMCVVLMCHCVRHIGLDNKHGRSVEAIHSFLSRWKACTELCAGTQKSRAARRARWGARTVRGAHPGFGSPP